MLDRDIKNKDLQEQAGFTAPTMSKLKKDKVVTTDIITRICRALNVQPGDIMEYVPDIKEDPVNMQYTEEIDAEKIMEESGLNDDELNEIWEQFLDDNHLKKKETEEDYMIRMVAEYPSNLERLIAEYKKNKNH